MNILEVIKLAIQNKDMDRLQRIFQAISDLSTQYLASHGVTLFRQLHVLPYLFSHAVKVKSGLRFITALSKTGGISSYHLSDAFKEAHSTGQDAVVQFLTEGQWVPIELCHGELWNYIDTLSTPARHKLLAQIELGKLILDINAHTTFTSSTTRNYPQYLERIIKLDPIVLSDFINAITACERENPFITSLQWEIFKTAMTTVSFYGGDKRKACEGYQYQQPKAELPMLPEDLHIGFFSQESRTFEQALSHPKISSKERAALTALIPIIEARLLPFGITTGWGKEAALRLAPPRKPIIGRVVRPSWHTNDTESKEESEVPSPVPPPKDCRHRTSHRLAHRKFFQMTFPAVPTHALLDESNQVEDSHERKPLLSS